VSDHRFGVDVPYRLGVEEELLLVDRQSFALAPATERVLATAPPGPGHVKGELSEGMIELVTDIVPGTPEAAAALARLRQRVCETGIGLLGAGLHPTAPFGDVTHRNAPRYAAIGDDTRGLLRMTPHCGLHVHVGMPDAETAIRACNGMRRWIPLLQAVSANSPFWHGRDSGLASARTVIAHSMPRSRSGTPPTFRDYDDYVAMVERICRVAEVQDYTMIWWDLRPNPRLGTLEVRCLDAQTSLHDLAGLVALTHCLAVYEAIVTPPSPSPPPEVIAEASFRALRDGRRARLDLDGAQRPVPEIAREALCTAHAVSHDERYQNLLQHVQRIVADGNGADRQRAAHAVGGMPAVLRAVTIDAQAAPVPGVAASPPGFDQQPGDDDARC
jgi:carboxylate-amine ligase